MDPVLYENIIDVCAILMLLLSVLSITTTRMGKLVQHFAIHSLVLAVIAFVVAYYTGKYEIYFTFALTLVLKVYVIPKFLNYTMHKINAEREIEPLVGIPGSLLICTALILISYLAAEPMVQSLDALGSTCFAVSLSIVLIGMFMMASRRKALTESIGLLLVENGLFLGTLTISYGMPLVVEFGVFFDVIIAVVIIGIFAYRINRTFNSVDTTFMRRLKDD
ncbi:MAG: hydrogenase [archaeon]|nr:hydrogenase [archaeon]